nr:unnamed protein product [Fasciola hepatica]
MPSGTHTQDIRITGKTDHDTRSASGTCTRSRTEHRKIPPSALNLRGPTFRVMGTGCSLFWFKMVFPVKYVMLARYGSVTKYAQKSAVSKADNSDSEYQHSSLSYISLVFRTV